MTIEGKIDLFVKVAQFGLPFICLNIFFSESKRSN